MAKKKAKKKVIKKKLVKTPTKKRPKKKAERKAQPKIETKAEETPTLVAGQSEMQFDDMEDDDFIADPEDEDNFDNDLDGTSV